MNRSFVPIYQKLFDLYKNKIVNQALHPGVQIDSINRMMQRHSVSRETAKLVLRKLTEGKLIVSIPGKGSFVREQIETNNTWVMVLPFYSSNMEQLINKIDQEAMNRGKSFTYFFHYNNAEDEMRIVGSMVQQGYEAILVVPNYDETLTAEFYRKLSFGNSLVLLLDNTMSGSFFRYAVQSYDLGVKRAIDYLVTKCNNNLLFIKNSSWKGRNLLFELMENTFSNIISTHYPDRSLFVISNINDLNIDFLLKNLIGGVLCCQDTDAVRLLGRLKSWNITVPQGVSVVNYGNTELTQIFEPAITVVDCLYDEMAAKASELIDQGESAGRYEQHVIQPKLIIRNT